MYHSEVIISPRLKHKVDKYVRYVNIVIAVLFTKTSIVCSCGFPCGTKNTRFYLSSQMTASAVNRKEAAETVSPTNSILTTIETCVPSVVRSRGREGWGTGEGDRSTSKFFFHLNEMCVC